MSALSGRPYELSGTAHPTTGGSIDQWAVAVPVRFKRIYLQNVNATAETLQFSFNGNVWFSLVQGAVFAEWIDSNKLHVRGATTDTPDYAVLFIAH